MIVSFACVIALKGLWCYNDSLTSGVEIIEGILRGVFQNFNPLCGRNPIENGS